MQGAARGMAVLLRVAFRGLFSWEVSPQCKAAMAYANAEG